MAGMSWLRTTDDLHREALLRRSALEASPADGLPGHVQPGMVPLSHALSAPNGKASLASRSF
jgi:hypothetical protein